MSSTERKILNLVKQANPSNPLAYVRDIVKDYSRGRLDQYILQCQDCELCAGPKSLTKGNTNADVMIIGESVSEVQAQRGTDIVYPLEGTKGNEMLQKVLEHYSVNPDEIFYMNVVNCFPHKEMDGEILPRTPSKKEVDSCKTFVHYAIDVIRPSLIILLGSVALNVFKQEAISKARGQWIEVRGIRAMPTYHPEYFVQIEGKKHPDIIDELKIDFQEDLHHAFLDFQERFPDNNVLLSKLEE
ncbi:uracil-DNA glycosylase [Bacillus spizizenii]|nr:uracil-DNA glycosylase [Bacillus spizizenii]MCY8890433.1 uracil-DNA glycosylase [Bacillus spizizenii]MEC0841888.1 uracil-DNA glycosylase [Bacillus spizizenii]